MNTEEWLDALASGYDESWHPLCVRIGGATVTVATDKHGILYVPGRWGSPGEAGSSLSVQIERVFNATRVDESCVFLSDLRAFAGEPHWEWLETQCPTCAHSFSTDKCADEWHQPVSQTGLVVFPAGTTLTMDRTLLARFTWQMQNPVLACSRSHLPNGSALRVESRGVICLLMCMTSPKPPDGPILRLSRVTEDG
jgi:hypothetical protein